MAEQGFRLPVPFQSLSYYLVPPIHAERKKRGRERLQIQLSFNFLITIFSIFSSSLTMLCVCVCVCVCVCTHLELPGGASGKELACQCSRCKRHRFDPWVWKIPWRRQWQPTPEFLPGESHGQRSLVGCSPWGCRESDTTDWASTHMCALSICSSLPPPTNTLKDFRGLPWARLSSSVLFLPPNSSPVSPLDPLVPALPLNLPCVLEYKQNLKI